MKKLIFLAVSAIIATTVAVFNVTPIKDTKTADVKTVEVVEQVKPIVEVEEVSIIQPVEQVTIEEPKIITEEEKQQYIETKYQEFCKYFFQHALMVQVWANVYFYKYPEKFTYELVDTNLEKIKNHFIDMTHRTMYPEVVERAKSLVL